MPAVPHNAPSFPIQLRFGDIDSYGHVNNVTYLGYLETARVLLHQLRPDAAAGQAPTLRDLGGIENQTLVGRQEIEYLAPLEFRTEPVHVSVWVTRTGNSSFDLGYAVTGSAGGAGTVYALGASTMVLASAATGRPVRLPDDYRRALERWSGPAVPFRRAPAGTEAAAAQ